MHITGHLNVHKICLIRHAEFVYGTPHSDASTDTSGFSYRHVCDMPNSCMKCRIRVWYTSLRCLDRHVGTFRSTHTWHAKFVYDMSQSDAVFTHDMPHSEASIDTDIRIDAYVTCRIHVGQVLFGYPVWILPHLTHTRLTLTSFDTYLVWHLPRLTLTSFDTNLVWHLPRLTLSDIQIDLKVASYSCLTYPKKCTWDLRMRNSKFIRHAYEERSISWMNMHVTCDISHCKCYTFEIHQIQTLEFLGTNSNSTRQVIFYKSNLYLVALLGKMICNVGDPVSLRHPVWNTLSASRMTHLFWTQHSCLTYGVATISRLLKILHLFCRIKSLL